MVPATAEDSGWTVRQRSNEPERVFHLPAAAAAAAKSLQSCPTLCDPVDSTVRGILQARIQGDLGGAE